MPPSLRRTGACEGAKYESLSPCPPELGPEALTNRDISSSGPLAPRVLVFGVPQRLGGPWLAWEVGEPEGGGTETVSVDIWGGAPCDGVRCKSRDVI